MTSSRTLETVRDFLWTHDDCAFLVSEVAAAVRDRIGSESELSDALAQLAECGEVFSRTFPVRDPHLAFTSLQFVAAVKGPEHAREAEMRTNKAYQDWLRLWLASHRCS